VTSRSTRTLAPAEQSALARVTPHPDFADTVMALVNQERTAAACPALTPNETLIQVARAHSQDMAVHRFLEHTGSDRRTPAQRVQDAGYQYRIVAENVAAGRLTPGSVVQGWMESSEHRANILNCELRDTYKKCERVLADELGVQPMAETTALFYAILHGEPLPDPSEGADTEPTRYS